VNVGPKKKPSVPAVAVTDINDPKQLDGLAKRLLAFARRYAAIHTWWLGEAGALAKGNTVEDVVRRALVSLFGEVEPSRTTKAGKRRWDPVKYPEPFVYLMLFVKTELRNLSVSSENTLSSRDVDEDALITNDTPEAILLQMEADAENEERVARAYSLLIDEIGDDNQLSKLHDLAINEDLWKPKRLAERLGMSVKDVNNLRGGCRT
jgi:hypothetical protein